MTMGTSRTVALLLSLTLVLMLMGGCAPKQAARLSRAEAPAAAPPAPPAGADAVSGGGEEKEVAASPASADEPPSAAANRKIITTGTMALQVRDLDQAVTELTRLVQQAGGFFSNKTISAEESWRHAELTIRVPADSFGKLHDGARALGTVTRDEQQGEDVTKQWQDLEARIKIRQAEEQSLVRLMARQARLADLLEVEKRLWEVREQIEQAQGELRVLRDQVTLATLTISLSEEVPAGVGKVGPWNLGYHLLSALKALVSAVRGLIIAVIYAALPGAVVWVPLVLLIRWLRRRARARRAVPPPPPSAKS
jgi:hypothetical protein